MDMTEQVWFEDGICVMGAVFILMELYELYLQLGLTQLAINRFIIDIITWKAGTASMDLNEISSVGLAI